MTPDLQPNRSSILQDMQESGGSPRDLANAQITQLRQLFADPNYGLWHFNREIMGFRDLKWELHGPLCQFVGHWGTTFLNDGQVIQTTPDGTEELQIRSSFRRLMVRIPRECFKTSCFTRGAGLRTIALDPNATIGIFNEKESGPESWIAAIAQVVQSSILFQIVFREVLPKGISYWDQEAGISPSRKLKWGSTGLMFERSDIGVSELTMEPHGISGTAVGKHFTHMIWDDIIGLKAQQSEAVMNSAIDWVDNSRAIERPLEGGNVLCNHTTWAYYDVYKYMEQKWPGEWQIFRRSLLENPDTGEPDSVHGVSIFPEKISTLKAYKMKTADPFVFASQYMCQPRAGRSQSFDATWDGAFHIDYQSQEPLIVIDRTGGLDHFNSTVFDRDLETLDNDPVDHAPQYIPLSWCEKAIILDPAPSKGSEVRQNRNAKNGIVVMAIDPWGRLYNFDSLQSAGTVNEVLDQMVSLTRQWKANIWAVEEVNFSAVYAPLWQSILNLDTRYNDIQPEWRVTEPKGRDKEGRIRQSLIGDHENGLWHYNRGNPASTEPGCPSGYLLKEKEEFPHGATVDCLDAAAYTKEVIHKPQSPDIIQRNHYRQRSTHEDRGVTGYGW